MLIGLANSRVGAGLCCWSQTYSRADRTGGLGGFSRQGAPRAGQMLKKCRDGLSCRVVEHVSIRLQWHLRFMVTIFHHVWSGMRDLCFHTPFQVSMTTFLCTQYVSIQRQYDTLNRTWEVAPPPSRATRGAV